MAILHGIYGRGRNWLSIARQFVSLRDTWRVILPDLPNHGESRGFPPPHTIATAADAVTRLMQRHAGDGVPVRALVGHSYGGKVVLTAAASLPGLEQVWLMDSTPEPRAPIGLAWSMLEIVRSLPPTYGSRVALIQELQARGLSADVGAWMATNLEHLDGAFRWAIDFDAMDAMLRDFFDADLWPIVEAPPPHLHIHVVKALASDTISQAALERLRAASRRTGRVSVHTIDGGHWVNVENPGAVMQLLTSHLS